MVMALAFVIVMRIRSLRVAYSSVFDQVMLVIDGLLTMGMRAGYGDALAAVGALGRPRGHQEVRRRYA